MLESTGGPAMRNGEDTQLRQKLYYIASVVIFGTIGYILHFMELPSEMIVFWRSALGALFIVAVKAVRREKTDWQAIRRNGKWLLLSGLGLGLNWVCLFEAYVSTTVAVASLFNYTAPLIFLMLSPMLYRTRLTWKQLLCVVVAAVGIVLVSGVLEGGTAGKPVGMVMAALAALGFVLVLVCNRRFVDLPALDRVMVQLSLAAVVVLPYVLVRNGGIPWTHDVRTIALLVLVGFFHTGFAYVLYFGSVATLPVHTVALLGYVEPVVSVLVSALLLHEPLTLLGVIGAVLIIGAAVVSEITGEKETGM